MALAPFDADLPADRIEVYGFAEVGGWQFLTMYSLGDTQCFGTYLGDSYDDAMREAHRLEMALGLPSYDWVGLFGHEFEGEAV